VFLADTALSVFSRHSLKLF